jgi:hypothetical protein
LAEVQYRGLDGNVGVSIMRSVPDRSTWHPEDDLPDWVFRTEECDKCGDIIDEGHRYSEYEIAVCSCGEEE